jgi:hypothetical protein
MLILLDTHFCQASRRVGGLHHHPDKEIHHVKQDDPLQCTHRVRYSCFLGRCSLRCHDPAKRQCSAGGLGEEVLQKAEGSGGMLGSVAQLGTTITDMEKHVTGLQQNLDALKKVEAALHMGGK